MDNPRESDVPLGRHLAEGKKFLNERHLSTGTGVLKETPVYRDRCT